jgi:uncharacterized protein (DUF1499 family)
MTASSTPSAGSPASSGLHSVAMIGLLLALLCALALVTSGFGYRWGWWGLRTAFTLLRWSAYGGVVAGVASLVGLSVAWLGVARGGAGLALVGLLVSLGVVGMPWAQLRRARRAPPIHDITTDTGNPPPFVAVLPLRAAAPNSADYGGPGIAAKQLAAYPDIQPALLALPPAPAFQRALAAARQMGWQIVATDSAAGRIEATATTFWYGFKDDVVIRLTPDDRGTRVDLRSESRVGGSDIGTNARRIREYLKNLSGA